MYDLRIRPFVRRMEPERASEVALGYYKVIGHIPGGRQINRLIHRNRSYGTGCEVFGLNFYNPLGLGAGLDRKGELFGDLEDLGFSFVEIGPLDLESTRKAIVNIQTRPHEDILAACLKEDIVTSFSLIYDFCDFFVIDLSDGFDEKTLDQVIDVRLTYDEYKPVVLKVSENISDDELKTALEYCMLCGIDGIQVRKVENVAFASACTGGRLPIIANCHVKTPEMALLLLKDGASLVEVRSGVVSEGTALVRRILKYLEKNLNNAKS